MTINDNATNLNVMMAAQMQVLNMTQNLAQVANGIGDPEFQEAAGDIIDSMVEQIPEIISYQANAKGIEAQSAMLDTLLNIKA